MDSQQLPPANLESQQDPPSEESLPQIEQPEHEQPPHDIANEEGQEKNQNEEDLTEKTELKQNYYQRTEVSHQSEQIEDDHTRLAQEQPKIQVLRVPTPPAEQVGDERQRTLEAKLQFYESEHQTFQNQLLVQRQTFEQELSQLREQNNQELSQEVEKLRSENSGLQAKLRLLQDETQAQTDLDTLRTQLAATTDDNARLQELTSRLAAELEALKADGVSLGVFSEPVCNIVAPPKRQDSQANFQKLQKRLDELEAMLQEKDRSLLEQEQQLSELQDQVHEGLKLEDQLRTQLREKGAKIDDLLRELKFVREAGDLKLLDMQNLIKAKEASVQDALNLVTEKELEIQRLLRQVRDAEDAIKEYRGRNLALEEEAQASQQREQEAAEELEQLKADFEVVIGFKNELELLVEEQTQHIDQRNKRLAAVEEALRFREQELEKKEGLLRRVSQGAEEAKKKLSQAEMKLRQVTQTTVRDMKLRLKDKLQEVEVLKEMVKSANKQAKAKDIDIQRLTKRVQRLEKMTELGKGIIGTEVEARPSVEEPDASFASPPLRNDTLGLNPLNYNQSVEEEVQQELLAAQQQRQFKQHETAALRIRNSKQKEIEEALELDRMLEQERRHMSQDVFQKKLEEKYDKYFNNVNSGVPANLKNNSSGVKGVFGGSGGVDDDPVRGDSHYDGLLPNLNMSRREQLEQELMNEISEPRKDKYMTPNLHGGKLKAINKLAAYSNQGGRSNAPYFHERNSNTSKNRIQI